MKSNNKLAIYNSKINSITTNIGAIGYTIDNNIIILSTVVLTNLKSINSAVLLYSTDKSNICVVKESTFYNITSEN